MATTKAFELAQLSALTTVDASGNVSASTNKIANASGDLTLDSVAGDIVLDAHGNQVIFKGSGGQVGFIDLATGRMDIKSSTADQQMRFQGNDAGVPINALVLDMAASGAATFLDQVTIGGNLIHAGNLTIDAGGDITLNADGADVILADGAVEFGRFKRDSGHLVIKSETIDKSVIIKGTTTSNAVVTALTFDMANSGRATFNENVVIQGDLTVEGTQVTLNTTALDVEDKNITLNYHASSDTSASAGGAGITIQDAVDASNDASILWNATNDEFDFSHAITVPSTLTLTSNAPRIFLYEADTTDLNTALFSSGGKFTIRTTTDDDATRTTRLEVDHNNGNITFYDSAGDAGLVWDAGEGTDGALLIGGHTDLRAGSVAGRNDAQLSLESTNYHNAIFVENQNTANGYHLVLGKTRGTAVNAVTIVQAEDEIGSLTFAAADGTDLRPKVAQISAYVSAGTTPATNAVSGELRFGTTSQAQDTTTRMVLSRDGHLGIGTLLPETLLHVEKSSTALYTSNMSGLGSYTPSGADMIQVRNTNTGLNDIYAGIWFETGTGATNTTGTDRAGRIALVVDNDSAYSSNFVFQTRSANAQLTEKMRITQDGNVGIGNTDPKGRLHLNDSGTAIPTSGYGTGLMVSRTDGLMGTMFGFLNSPQSGYLQVANFTNTDTLPFLINPRGGNVGIGTDTPTTMLQVGNSVSGETGLVIFNSEGGNQSGLLVKSRTNRATLQVSDNDSNAFVQAEGSHAIYGQHSSLASADMTIDAPGNMNLQNGSYYVDQVRHSIRPSLNLDFANSKELDSRITFYRDSIATYYDSKGVLKYANVNEPRFDHVALTGESKGLLIEEGRTNYIPFSTPNAAWSSGYRFITNNYAIAPDGTHSASFIHERGTSGQQLTFTGLGNVLTSGSTYTASVYAKAGTHATFQLHLYGDSSASFNLSSPSSSSDSTMTDVGNGWYRCTWTKTKSNTSGTMYLGFSGSSYAGDVSKGVLFWGAQLELGDFATSLIPSDNRFNSRSSTATYHDETGIIRTAPVNSARYGHKYDGRKWVETGLIVEAAVTNLIHWSEGLQNWTNAKTTDKTKVYTTLAPDGSYNAAKLEETSETGEHAIIKHEAIPAGMVTLSIFAKAAERSVFGIQMYNSGGTIGGTGSYTSPISYFNLSTGTVSNAESGINPTITSAGNGWWRISVTGISTSAGQTASCWMYTSNTTTYSAHTGTAGSGVYLWGGQLEAGPAPTSYIPTNASQVTRSVDSVSGSTYTTREDDAVYIDNMQYSDWYNREEGTYYLDLDAHTTTDTDVIVLGQPGYPWILYKYASAAWKTYNGNNSIDYPLNNITPFKGAISFGKTSGSTAQNGTAILTNNANLTQGVELSNMSTLDIGYGRQAGANTFNGTIKKISYYPTEMTSAELVALTENN